MNWQPIDTAPKDGSRILCFIPGYWPMFLVWKENKRFNPTKHYFGDPNEWDDYELIDHQPTFWMPLEHPK